MLQSWIELAQPEQRPVTVACNVTCPFARTAAAAGETVKFTLFASNPLPVPQLATTISRISDPAHRNRFKFITDLQPDKNSRCGLSCICSSVWFFVCPMSPQSHRLRRYNLVCSGGRCGAIDGCVGWDNGANQSPARGSNRDADKGGESARRSPKETRARASGSANSRSDESADHKADRGMLAAPGN